MSPRVRLELGDCLELLPELCPAPGAIVTDPPFGTGAGGYRTGIGGEVLRIANDLDTEYRDRLLALYPDTPAYVFGALHRPPPPGTVQTLAYKKRDSPFVGALGARGGWRRDLEGIYMVGPWATGQPFRSSILATTQRRGAPSDNGHIHAKPLDILATLIRHCPPGPILDPFAGSGTTLIAAAMLDREAIGIELDPAHYANARRNLARHGIETPGEPLPVQSALIEGMGSW